MARRQSYPALGGGRIIRAGTKASENEKIPVSKALKNKIAGRSRKTAEKARLRRLCKQRSCGRHTYHYPGKLMPEICGGLNQFQLKFALTQGKILCPSNEIANKTFVSNINLDPLSSSIAIGSLPISAATRRDENIAWLISIRYC